MSRINTNIAALTAIYHLQKNQNDLALHLQRLSSGLQINSGKDNPAGLIASQNLQSEMAGINQAIDNSNRAGNVINTADGALSEVSSLLLQVQSLTNQAANSGALSPSEIQANQLQVDSILNSINRIANTTEFNGVQLLNGGLNYTTSGVNGADIGNAQIYAVQIPHGGATNVTVQVTASAKLAYIGYNASGIGATPTTIEITGNLGTQQVSFAASAKNSAVVAAINQLKAETGVSAVLSGSKLKLNSVAYGSSQFVSVKTIAGSFTTTANKASGANATVSIDGQAADTNGLVASIRNGNQDITLTLSAAFATQTATTTNFYVTGGGAQFQLGSRVNAQGQTNIGIQSIATTGLGDSVNGYLSSMASGGTNSLISGKLDTAQIILNTAIEQVATLQGRLGAFQKDIIDPNVNSLNVTLENVTASESNITDANFAAETSALTRAQILVQAGTSVLASANNTPQSVLTLLQGH